MDVAWIVLGTAILLITLLDTFLAVLNYDESGIFVNRLVRLEWVIIRSFTRRASRRWRPLLLRQVTGILILTTILIWIGGIVLGFALIYLGWIGLGAFEISEGTNPDFVGALYLSVGQFSTVGAENIAPAHGWVNLIPVLEAITSIVLLSFIITFFSNIYGTIQLLRSLCADFFSGGAGVGDPAEGLRPYFPDGEPVNLDRHLDEMIDDFNLYCDSLRQTHAAYNFQSGEDQFSMPYAMYMTAGVVGALRWGLPTGHAVTKAPALLRLTESFNEFRDRRYRMMKWPRPEMVAPASPAQFAADFAQFMSGGSRSQIDPWTLRFLALDQAMAEMIHSPQQSDAAHAYARYAEWLPFAAPAQELIARIARDLDYQPIYRGLAVAPDAAPIMAAGSGKEPRAVRSWLRRRLLFLDPGLLRLRTASVAVASAAVAACAAALITAPLGVGMLTAAVFSGLIALFVAPASSAWRTGTNRARGLITVVPVTLGIVAGAYLPRDPVSAMIILAIVAAVAVWVARFGAMWGVFGAAAFIAYYFTLLIAVPQEQVVGMICAGLIGVICSWLATLLPATPRDRQLRAGITDLNERVTLLLDAAVRTLSVGRDRRLEKMVHAETVALTRSAAWLTALLTPDAGETDVSAVRDRSMSRRVIDLQLAVQSFLAALPDDSDYAVTIADRAVLAGVIVEMQARLRSLRDASGTTAVLHDEAIQAIARTTPGSYDSRRMRAAIVELSDAVSDLHASLEVDEPPAGPQTLTGSRGSVATTAETPRVAAKANNAAIDRRAIQSGLSTGLALLLAGLVSTSLQYWAAMPAFQALSGTDGDRAKTTALRLVGTVVGAGAAFGLALATHHAPVIAILVLAISAFFMSSLRPVASTWTAFWQTVLLATAYDLLSPLDAEAVQVRVVETLIGAGVAILISLVILPTRTRSRVLTGMTGVLTAAQSATSDSVQRILDSTSTTAGPLVADRALLTNHATELQAIADRLKTNAGSAQPSGVQAQVAALSALLAYADRLTADAQVAAPAPTATAAEWQRLDALTRDNFEAALAVLAGRLPGRVHREGDLSALTGPAPTQTEGDALVSVERVNQCLLMYMRSINPGAIETGES